MPRIAVEKVGTTVIETEELRLAKLRAKHRTLAKPQNNQRKVVYDQELERLPDIRARFLIYPIQISKLSRVTPDTSPAIPTENAPSTAGMTTRVVKGSLWTLAGHVSPLVVSLITTPFVIRMLGAEGYGVLILVALIPAYLGFTDFGMSMASTKFASEAYAQGDLNREARIVRTAALIALCNSLPVALVLFFFSPRIIMLFNVPENLRGEAPLALKFAAVTFVLNFLNGIFNTPQLTRLRMDLNTMVNAGFRILGLIATPFAIYFDGVVGAVFVLMVASFLTLLGHLFVSRRLNRSLFGFRIERAIIPAMLKFGGALALAGVAATVLVNAEKGILSSTASVRALAHYSVAFTLAGMLTIFASAMAQSLIPAFSQLRRDSNTENLEALFARAIKVSLIWVFPVVVVLAIVARQFFTVWAGAEFGEESTMPFYVLLVGLAFNVLCYLPYSAIMAEGRTGSLAMLYWIELVPYGLLVWYLTVRFGPVGAALAWTTRMIFDTLVMFYIVKKLSRSLIRRLKFVYLAFGAAILLTPVVIGIVLNGFGPWLILLSLVSLVCYAAVVWYKILDSEEISWLNLRLSTVFRR